MIEESWLVGALLFKTSIFLDGLLRDIEMKPWSSVFQPL